MSNDETLELVRIANIQQSQTVLLLIPEKKNLKLALSLLSNFEGCIIHTERILSSYDIVIALAPYICAEMLTFFNKCYEATSVNGTLSIAINDKILTSVEKPCLCVDKLIRTYKGIRTHVGERFYLVKIIKQS